MRAIEKDRCGDGISTFHILIYAAAIVYERKADIGHPIYMAKRPLDFPATRPLLIVTSHACKLGALNPDPRESTRRLT